MEPIADLHATYLLLMTFLPMIVGLVLLALPRGYARLAALIGTLVTLMLSFGFSGAIFDRPESFIAAVNRPWIPEWGISLLMGMDGLSGSLILLTNVLMVFSVMASWTAIRDREREFYFYLLLLHTGIIGTFLALDLVLFYVFWELMLVPLYFLIGIFGSGRRIYATMKFFLYTMAGSVLMLLGILAVYYQAGPHVPAALLGEAAGTFSLPALLTPVKGVAPVQMIDPGAQTFIFLAFLIAFAIKVPLFPLHTWLPDAHTEAPTAGSVILAGVLLKTGVYGLLRFAIPMFPEPAAWVAPAMGALSVVAIIYGAFAAFAQDDMKRLVAYSSVSHMGFIVLGVFAFQREAVTGASLQMINHGISTGGLFLCVGYLYERRHTRDMREFGGLALRMKIYATLTMIMVLSSVGLPGLNGFVGEFPILIGAYKAEPWWAVVGSLGVILAACYLLRMMQMTFFGPIDKEANRELRDLNLWETVPLAVLAVAAFAIGLYPRPLMQALEPSSIVVTAAARPYLKDAGSKPGADGLMPAHPHAPADAHPSPVHQEPETDPPAPTGHGHAAHVHESGAAGRM